MDTLSSVREGPLTVRIDEAEDSIAVRAFGEVDATTATTLEGSLRTVLEGGAASVVLDLTEVRSIDAAGVRVLLWAAERACEFGDRLRIRCGAEAVGSMIAP